MPAQPWPRPLLLLMTLWWSSEAFLSLLNRPVIRPVLAPTSTARGLMTNRRMTPTMDQPLEWKVNNEGRLMLGKANEQLRPFRLKGISWSGLEGESRTLGGLWNFKISEVAGFLRYHGFNAVRLPVSVPFCLNINAPASGWVQDQELNGASHRYRLEQVIRRLGAEGIFVMLDMHRIEEREKQFEYDGAKLQGQVWFTTDPQNDKPVYEEDFNAAWDNLLGAYGNEWNVFACDLKNEPSGPAVWGEGELHQRRGQPNGDKKYYWNLFAEDLIDRLQDRNKGFKGLFFVEGVERTTYPTTGWGCDISGCARYPIRVLPDRVVYSPHAYGPSVFDREYFKYLGDKGNKGDYTWPFQAWDVHWGFARIPDPKDNNKKKAVVIGEWGGWMSEKGDDKYKKDEDWHRAMVEYMRKTGALDQFFWVLNPGFGDSGGFIITSSYDPDHQADWPSRDSSGSPGSALKPTDAKRKLLHIEPGGLYEGDPPTVIRFDGTNLQWGTWLGEGRDTLPPKSN